MLFEALFVALEVVFIPLPAVLDELAAPVAPAAPLAAPLDARGAIAAVLAPINLTRTTNAATIPPAAATLPTDRPIAYEIIQLGIDVVFCTADVVVVVVETEVIAVVVTVDVNSVVTVVSTTPEPYVKIARSKTNLSFFEGNRFNSLKSLSYCIDEITKSELESLFFKQLTKYFV